MQITLSIICTFLRFFVAQSGSLCNSKSSYNKLLHVNNMGHHKANRVRAALVLAALLVTALLVKAAPSQAIESDLYLAGLGLHQETGRNIYLGGIYLEREAPKPNKLIEATGYRVMEYRVVARRTSIRSLLGGMLLQSEVATKMPPNKATADFVDAILNAVNTSLYAGDSLEIRLTEKNDTIAMLNGHELARIGDKTVADYLLMGWVGDSGPSTSFRQGITAEQVDPSLLSELEANRYSAQREAEIASWLTPEDATQDTTEGAANPAESNADNTATQSQSTVAATTTSKDASGGESATAEPAQPQASETLQFVQAQVAPLESVVPEAPALAEVSTSVAQKSSAFTDQRESAGQQQGLMQVASLLPTADMLQDNSLENEIRALDIQEYSQRLSAFHTRLVRMVYGEIHYPKRAVRRGLQGRLELDVTLNASGKVLNVSIAMPSGYDLLDRAAIAAAEKALSDGIPDGIDPVAIAEFGDFGSEQLTVPVPVSFLLQ